MSKLPEIAYRIRELVSRTKTRPHEYIRLLPPQYEVASCPDPIRLFRAGNQSLGKSWLGLLECIWRATGEHPYQPVTKPPVEIYIICDSDQQSLAIQEKLWSLLPKDLITDTEYVPGIGFRGRPHVVKFTNGSLITFKTVKAGSMGLAGATVDFILFDEPPEQRIYGEAVKRVQAKNGKILLTMTPINRDCTWLKELVQAGKVTDLHYRLEPQHLIPIGASKPLTINGIERNADWIAQVEYNSLELELPVVVHGEWEFRSDGNVFRRFDPQIHVAEVDIPKDADLYLGIDHGSGKDFSSVAVLVAHKQKGDEHSIWILDEYISDGETTINDDCKAILAMLEAWNLQWGDLTRIYGDRLWQRASGAIKKSNPQLEREFMKILNVKRLNPRIEVVYKPSGSVEYGTRFLHDRILKNEIVIMPHCERTIESFQKWDYSKDSEYKHAIDATRYALQNVIWAKKKRSVLTIKNG